MEKYKRCRRESYLATAVAENKNQGQEILSHSDFSMMDLPSPIVVDILSRLPTRTLLNCRCICKTWFNLLLDPYFNSVRLAKMPYIKIIILSQNYGFYLIELAHQTNYIGQRMCFRNTKTSYPELELVGCCNGLLCFSNGHPNDNFYISNPILGEYIALPNPKPRKELDCVAYGFGFSSATNQYKVVRIVSKTCEITQKSETVSQVCTLGAGTWRNVGEGFFPVSGKRCGVILNGVLNWIVGFLVDRKKIYSIYSFDIEDEQFRPIPLPLDIRNKRNFVSLGVLGNCLCVFDNRGSQSLDIWSMKDYAVATSWTKDCILRNTLE
ncbi:F-box protein At3g07870-like [Cornus florida]|uniref:F-box protein At3g07870-like n=1 Tax=Cornus florida TaxID=4283 RepID=UPI002896C8E5|nr:F-box protein At3g07870-like [Cornus florida]